MVKHVVMFSFKESDEKTAAEHAQTVKKMGLALLGTIESLKSIEMGINEVESNKSHDLVLISTFDDYDGLKAYDAHPEHQKVVEYIKAHFTERHAVDFTF